MRSRHLLREVLVFRVGEVGEVAVLVARLVVLVLSGKGSVGGIFGGGREVGEGSLFEGGRD
jgi:hypothetical protein